MKKPYVHSNFERIANDNYQTIDPRCVSALVGSFPIQKDMVVADCCSPNGSGILTEMENLGYKTKSIDDAFSYFSCGWNIFNPPYDRKIVDKIVWKQIEGLECENFYGMALLVRNNFDFAKSRHKMFTHKYYTSQIHMMFRPWWVVERKAQPIHNYVWHIWTIRSHIAPPTVIYWKE